MAKGARSAHDEAYEITPPACGSRPDFTFPIARTCDFSVGTAFVYCDLNPLTEPFFRLLSDKSQWSLSPIDAAKKWESVFRIDPKTDNNFWCFATLLVNREVFGHLLLTRQTTNLSKAFSLAIKILIGNKNLKTTTATSMPTLTRVHMSWWRVWPLFDLRSP